MSAQFPTPLPVGSPHIHNPPMFETKLFRAGKIGRLDRRDYFRRDVGCEIWLIDPVAQAVVRCRTNDISDAGLHATAPIGYGLAVGQRYEVRIAQTNTRNASSPRLAPSLGYSTILRIDLKVGLGDCDRVGFAVRFDVPQLLPV